MKKTTLLLFFALLGILNNIQVKAQSQTGYESTNTPFDIDGGGDVTTDCEGGPNIITMPGNFGGIIGEDADIFILLVEITHTFSGDLRLTLRSPAGTELLLSANNGGGIADAYLFTSFFDGGSDITTASPPFTGHSAQGGSFADTFAGEPIAGVWELLVCDDAGQDSGQVLNSTLVFDVFPPSNDLIENAINVGNQQGNFEDPLVNFLLASDDASQATDCTVTLNNAVWYTFTATSNGTVTAQIDTGGANDDEDSALIFYNGPVGANLNQIALENSGSNSCNFLDLVTIDAVEGQTYYLSAEANFNTTVFIFGDAILGTEANEIEEFTFFPNPVDDILNLNAGVPIESVSIFSISGQKIIEQQLSTTNSQLDLSNLTTGIYLMQAVVGGQEETFKIIKQ